MWTRNLTPLSDGVHMRSDAVPPWRRVEPTMVCEVRVTNLDLGRWARFPVAFVRWRTDLSVDDCGLEQLGS